MSYPEIDRIFEESQKRLDANIDKLVYDLKPIAIKYYKIGWGFGFACGTVFGTSILYIFAKWMKWIV